MSGPVLSEKAIGVVLAGGSGLRFSAALPKQFHNLAGRPIVEYAIETMARNEGIDRIYVVYPEGYAELLGKVIAKYRHFKSIELVKGGSSRAASTRAALDAIGTVSRRKVLFHDAVRPFLTDEILERCITGLDAYDSVDTVVPAVDTVVKLDESLQCLDSIPNRAQLRRGQTPQGFWLDQLSQAYEGVDDEGLNRFTDDCGVLLSRFPDARIGAVAGGDDNIKITTPTDMFLAEQILFAGVGPQGHPVIDRIRYKAVAAVFGATSGLGLASAERLQELGWTVESASRANGVDVRDPAQVEAFLQGVHERHGRIDLVANFSGVLHVGKLVAMEQQKLEETLGVNLMGSINVSRAAHTHLSATKGHLVLISSSSYYRGRGDTAAYSASKAAVVNLTQALADEWAADGVTVSCIVPRRADTPMRRNAFPDEDQSGNLSPNAVADAIVDLHNRQQTGIIKHVY